jgi:DNA-binding response OmpR family regulator
LAGRHSHAREIVNKKTPMQPQDSSKSGGRILVLEPDGDLASKIVGALNEAAPDAHVQIAHSLEEAQHLVLDERPDLFVLDVDATYDLGQEFLYDLRTSHPNARAIILTATHLADFREQAAGLGAIHFLEKPFPHGDFVDLVKALLHPSSKPDSEKFQGTLSDLHIADIIQLKCMSGSTSVVEFTGPNEQKARVYFENGQVRHATAPGKQGVAAFNEIVNWQGGRISEVSGAAKSPRTIDLNWQVLLMEAVRAFDEKRGATSGKKPRAATGKRGHVLVIDDSLMMLSFVSEILTEANFQVSTAPTAEEGLRMSAEEQPGLILLDFILPDMKGDEVGRRLAENPATANLHVVYMSGHGIDLEQQSLTNTNVIGFLNKPFTSDLLIKTVETYMPNQEGEPESTNLDEASPEPVTEPTAESAPLESTERAPAAIEPNFESAPSWETPAAQPVWQPTTEPQQEWQPVNFPTSTAGAYFCGDTSFFSLQRALHTIGQQKLTGTLRLYWSKEPVDLLARDGKIVLVTTRDPQLYCAEAPITLVNVDLTRTEEARDQQRDTGCPLFITLAREELILREPAMQLVQHYGQKLFAQLWAELRVRFMFEQTALPNYAEGIPGEDDADHWSLATLRFIQFHELGARANIDVACIPAYTRDGFERVQNLRLTVAEAQFASQFNGARSVQQIAKNLRLDLKFARLTLFRFLALEIIECWPPSIGTRQDRSGLFQRIGRSIGLGE